MSFMQLLWDVAHGLESMSKSMHAAVGVTGPQRLVLRLIGHYGRAAPGDLAEVLRMHPSSLTGVFRRLENAALIRRARDPDDGRRAILTLTPRGRTLGEQRMGTVESSVRKTLQGVSNAKVMAAREVLRDLARELRLEAEASRRSAAKLRAARSVKRRTSTGTKAARRRPRA